MDWREVTEGKIQMGLTDMKRFSTLIENYKLKSQVDTTTYPPE